jgi:hypothetical protein
MMGNKKRYQIGVIALSIIVLHIGLAFLAIAFGDRFIHNPVVKIYRQLVVLGPFFTESRIQDSHCLSITYKQNDTTWSSPRVLSKESFSMYSEKPGQLNRLAYLGYERYLIHSISQSLTQHSIEKVHNSSPFRELNGFLLAEIVKVPVDSMRLVYTLNHYIPDTKSYVTDTVFVHSYNPGSIAKVKK